MSDDRPRHTLASIMAEAFECAKAKGWHDIVRPLEVEILLMHTELSEAAEELRDGHSATEIRYEQDKAGNAKPEGVAVELADVIIRIAESCQKRGIPLEDALTAKLVYNRTRPYKHGGKAF